MKLEFDELLRYTQEERDKWRVWFVAHPEALEIEVQPGGRYRRRSVRSSITSFSSSAGTCSVSAAWPVDTKTGLSGRHAPPLFDYGASVRRELEQFTSGAGRGRGRRAADVHACRPATSC